jgi:hypothetical protein
MRYSTILLLINLFSYGCSNSIKDHNAQVAIEEGTAIDSFQQKNQVDASLKDMQSFTHFDTLARTYWVGSFSPHKEIDLKEKVVSADEGLYWSRENKISISIDSIVGDSAFGHSVVAGNHRSFQGTKSMVNGHETFVVNEPGDHKYDGQFTFSMSDKYLIGTWDAYLNIDIPKREYMLEEKIFKYDPNIQIKKWSRYGNWEKFIDHGIVTEVFDEGTPDEVAYEWEEKEYASTTDKIFEINASNTELKKEDVENLTNSDLVVIRNTIYARHGYSFKNRPLRVFFDKQKWYIPVHADIKTEFTEIEKKNIQLLLRYEKNAKEYYDYFGRG